MIKRYSLEEAAKYHKLDYWEINRAIGYTMEPDTKGFDTITYYGESLNNVTGSNKRPEWIYILANKYMSGILKIGFTTTSIHQRVTEINAATGVIYPWFPVFGYKTSSGYYLEKEIHRYMEGLGIRINQAREGFEIDIDTAIDIIETIGSNYKLGNVNK